VNTRDSKDSRVELLVARATRALAQRTTRKRFLARAGRFVLKAVGVAVLPILPVDRIVENAMAANGSAWYLCGMYGRACDCANCGGSLTSCPSGCAQGSSWVACCTDLQGYGRSISYFDCCETGSNCTACNSCNGCYNNPIAQPVWCGSASLIYRCTRYRINIGVACCT